MNFNTTLTIPDYVVAQMDEILDRKTGVKDTRDGDVTRFFTTYFENGFFAEISICNGSFDSSPWLDCALFDANGNMKCCYAPESDSLTGEFFFFLEDGDQYKITAKKEIANESY